MTSIEVKGEKSRNMERRWAVVVPCILFAVLFASTVSSGFNPMRKISVEIDWTSWDLSRGRFTVYGGRSSHDYDYWEVGPLTISQLVK